MTTEITSLYDAQECISEIGETLLKEATLEDSTMLGLDERCGKLYVGDDFLAVSVGADRWLQYYGGFEYIEKEYRQQIGDYVFYSVDADRVAEAFDHMNGSEPVEKDEQE